MHIENRKQFEAWLDEKKPPKEICVALAARAALRVLPLMAEEIPWPGERRTAEFERLVAALFAVAGVARFAACYANKAVEFNGAASYFARYSFQVSDINSIFPDLIYGLVRAVETDDPTAYVARLINSAARGATGVCDTAYWTALRTDVLQVGSDGDLRTLANMPLWPDAVPVDLTESWRRLSSNLPEAEGWSVWIDWYDARLSGGVPWSEAHEEIFATVPAERWDEGPSSANAWIRGRLQLIYAPAVAILALGPEATAVATHTEKIFDLRLNPHGRLAPHWLPADESAKNQYGGFSIEELYADARQACLDFADHALDDTAHNYMPRAVKRAAERLRDGLPPELAQTAPLSAERALAMALRAIGAAERDGDVPPQDMLFRHHLPELRGMYQRLAAIWPGLGDYREAARIDRFIEPDAEARKAQDLILATTAADASVASPALQASLNETIATLKAAEKDVPPSAGDEARRRSLYDAMKAAAAQIAPIWSWTQNAAMKVQKVSSDAETTVQNLEKLGQRIEKARVYWDWIEKWW